jgi:CRP-like cAMP-binding protein
MAGIYMLRDEQSSNTPINYNELKILLSEAFEQHGIVKACRKNSFLFKEGDEPEGVYYICKGLIKVMQSTEEGKNITFFLRRSNDIIGNSEVLLQKKRERYAQCLLDSEVRFIGASEYRRLVQSNINITLGMLILSTNTFLETMNSINYLVTKPVAWRITWLLMHLELVSRPDEYCLDLQLSHEEIAYIVGCSRQTVTKTLNHWRQEGLVSYSRKEIIIFDPGHFFSGMKKNN